jgi:hypothetical protein
MSALFVSRPETYVQSGSCLIPDFKPNIFFFSHGLKPQSIIRYNQKESRDELGVY